MKINDAYDLIVIGDQLSGLFLAAGAAQQGMKVLVLEESDFPTVLYEAPSGRLLADFIAEPVIGLQQNSKVDEFLKSLGLYQDLELLFPLHDPPVQLVSEGFRLDFPYNESELFEEIKREVQLPFDRSAALCRLLSGSVVSKKKFSALVSELGLPVAYEAIGKLQAALYGSLLPADLNYGDYKEIISKAQQGVRFPVGGRGALKERLLSRLQLFGGSLRRASRVEELVFERKRLSGVLLSSYEGFVRSHRVVGAMAAGSFARLIPADMRTRRLNDILTRLRPSAWKLGFTLLIPESVIPEGMGSHVALFDPDMGFDRDGFLQLQVFPKDIYGGIPPKHRVILGRMLLPFEASSISPKSIAACLKRSLFKIEGLMPFLKEQSYAFFPDPENLEKDPVFQRYYQFKSIDHIPGSLLVYENGFGDGHAFSKNLDWSSFGLDGVALCSRDIRPLHGLLGEMLSAIDLLAIWKNTRKLP